MLDVDQDYLDPTDPIFHDWDMTFDENVEGLKGVQSSPFVETQRLSFWLGMTFSSIAELYWTGKKESAIELIDLACAATNRATDHQLKDYEDIALSLLRLNLCRPNKNIDKPLLQRIYSNLPTKPNSMTVDVYVGYHCLLGEKSILEDWYANFESYKSKYGWHDYNKDQISLGLSYVKNSFQSESDIDLNIKAFADFVNEEVDEDDIILSDLIPWLHWYLEQNI